MNFNTYSHEYYQKMSREKLIEEIIKTTQACFLNEVFEENFSSFFLHSPMITMVISADDFRVMAANDLFFKTFAFSSPEVVGKELQTLRIWPSHDTLESFFADMVNPLSTEKKEYMLLNANTDPLYFQFSTKQHEHLDKKYIILWAIDITKLVASKRQLCETNRNFSAILENSPTAILRFDRRLICTYVNKTVEKFSGQQQYFFIGKTPEDMDVSKSFSTLWTNHLTAVLKSKKPISFTAKYRSPTGADFFYQARFIPVLNTFGTVDHILCTTHDITSLKRAELHLRMHHSRYAWYLHTIPDILCKCDIAGKYLDISGATKKLFELFELSESDCIGKNLHDTFPKEIAEKIISTIRRVYETHTIQTLEYTLMIGQKTYQFEARITSIPHTKEFLLTLRDITEIKELRNKVERLDRLQLVSEVASTLGHEIRNPLTTVCGFLQLMRRKDEYKQWREHFNLMLTELEYSNNIISDFLALTHDQTPLPKRQRLDELIAELKS